MAFKDLETISLAAEVDRKAVRLTTFSKATWINGNLDSNSAGPSASDWEMLRFETPKRFGPPCSIYRSYLAFRYQTERGWNAVLETNYSGELFANNANSVKVSSYVVTSLRLSYEFRNGDWMVRPYVGINNLFDESYNSNIRINAFGGRYFEPAPEQNFYAGVTVRFER